MSVSPVVARHELPVRDEVQASVNFERAMAFIHELKRSPLMAPTCAFSGKRGMAIAEGCTSLRGVFMYFAVFYVLTRYLK